MSPDTLRFLLDLLCRQQVAVGADDFEITAAAVVRAKAELRAAIDASEDAQ